MIASDHDLKECLATDSQQVMKTQPISQVFQVGGHAKVNSFSGGYDLVPEHLIEPHQEFIDDINQ